MSGDLGFESELPGGSFLFGEGRVALEEEEVSIGICFEETGVEVAKEVEVGTRDGRGEEVGFAEVGGGGVVEGEGCWGGDGSRREERRRRGGEGGREDGGLMNDGSNKFPV